MASSLSSYVVDTFNDKAFSKLAKPGAQLSARLEQVTVTRGLQFDSDLKKSVYLWAGAGIVLLHLVAVLAYLNYESPLPVVKPKHQVAIEFIKPEIPPPVAEPPPPPPPKVQKVAPPPQPIAAIKTAPALNNVAPTDMTIQENTHAEPTSAPVMAASGPLDKNAAIPEPALPAPPAPPAPKVEEPVTEATANAGYLNNPKPEYPSMALRQGWGGTVILRVRVLASGAPESVTLKKSSGKKVLDDAAINAVMKWTFVPSKRGSTPIDGWATVPMTFNPEQ